MLKMLNVDRPFTSKVRGLRARGKRYADLEAGCQRARSTAWFNNLVNSSDPWAVSPPGDDALDGLATLMGTTRRRVQEMIAEEWYQVRRTDFSPRVHDLASRLDGLSEDDAALVEALVQRLHGEGAFPDVPAFSLD